MEVPPPTSTEQRVDDALPAFPSTSLARVPLTYSSDPELNSALHALLDGVECSSSKDMVESDNMTPYGFDFLFPPTSLPVSPGLLPVGMSQSPSTAQPKQQDTLQPPTHPNLNIQVYPMHDSIPSRSPPLPGTSALPSSTQSGPEVCTDVSEDSNRNMMMASKSEMEVFFDIFSVPLPQSPVCPSLGESQPTQTEKVDTLQPSVPVAHASSCTLPLPELSTTCTSPQHSHFAPVSSTHSSDPELERVLLADNRRSQQDATGSDDTTYIFDLPPFLFPLASLPNDPGLLSAGLLQSASQRQEDTLQPPKATAHSHLAIDSLRDLPLPTSTDPPSPLPGTSAPSLSTHSTCSPDACTVNKKDTCSNREEVGSDTEYIFDLFSLLPLPQSTNLLPQEVSKPTSIEQRADVVQSPTSAVPPHGLPANRVINTQEEKSAPSPQSSHSLAPEKEGITSVCTHIYPDCSTIPEEGQSASLTEPSTASSSSLAPPSGSCLENNPVSAEESSTESASPVQPYSAGSSNQMTKKRKLTQTVSAKQKQGQSKLIRNKVSASNYRRRKKGKASSLEARREELEATNVRLKEEVSALTAKIDELKKLSQKTQRSKFCPFFLQSTCRNCLFPSSSILLSSL